MENPVHSRGACFPDPAPRFVRQVANVLKEMDVSRIRDAVARLCVSANRALPRDVSSALAAARDVEDGPVARDILDTIVENARMADPVPICQDTGMACVFLEVGQDVHLTGGSLRTAVDAGVAQGYSEGYLRKSLVSDPLERKNTGDNTPAMLYVDIVPGSAVTVTVAPKGAGSENMSRIAMLRPSDGAAGVMDFVLDTVEKAGPNPCPPIVVGVGIGGNFDKAALLAKRALLRPVGSRHPQARYAEMERELLRRINALGIGPQGMGGRTTALGVMIETMPTHIASLPCAVNINCHVARHVTEVLE